MQIINKTKNLILAQDAFLANSLFSRIKGLLGRDTLKPQEALVIKPCNSVHTFFMRFAIDVIFVDTGNKIVALENDLKPYKISPLYFKANYVVELPSGIIAKTNTKVGDEIGLAG